MKIEGVFWFTSGLETFGIVYGEDGITKARKAYVKKVKGNNEEQDIDDIAANGAKILPGQIHLLNDFLNRKDLK